MTSTTYAPWLQGSSSATPNATITAAGYLTEPYKFMITSRIFPHKRYEASCRCGAGALRHSYTAVRAWLRHHRCEEA